MYFTRKKIRREAYDWIKDVDHVVSINGKQLWDAALDKYLEKHKDR